MVDAARVYGRDREATTRYKIVDPPSWRARALTPFTRAYLGETVVQEVIRTLGLVNENLERSMAEEKLNRDLFPRDEFLSPR